MGIVLLAAVALAEAGSETPRLFTDDAIPRYLERARQLVEGKQWEKAADLLHRVLEADPALFPDTPPELLHAAVHSEDGTLFLPVRELCVRALASLPREGIEAYRAAHDREAEDLLRRAAEAPGPEEKLAAYSRVLDLYLVTSAGDDALERAGDLHLDLGRPAEAFECYRRIFELYPAGGDRPVAVALAKAAFAAARLGEGGRREALLERLLAEYPDARVEIEGTAVPAKSLADHPRMRVRERPEEEGAGEWPLAGGNAARNGIMAELSREAIPRKPLWSHGIAERDPRLIALADGWSVSRHDREAAAKPAGHAHRDLVRPYPALIPAVSDGLLFYKDYAELIDRSLPSGTLLRGILGRLTKEPKNPRFLYPIDTIRPRTRDVKRAGDLEEIYGFYDYGGNGVLLHGDRILVVTQRFPPSQFRRGGEVGNHLVCYERRPGGPIVRWAWGDMDGLLYPASIASDRKAREEWRDDYERHKGAVILGPGVARGALVYTLVREGGRFAGTALWAFRIEDGRVLFRTPLHLPDSAEGTLPLDATVAAAGGLVFAATGAGVVAAVDALPPGRIRWLRRYDRKYVAQPNGAAGAPRLQQALALNHPIVSGNTLVIAPPDAAAVCAFEAGTGELLWRFADIPGLAHVAGVSRGAVVLAGSQVVALELRSGKKRWSQPLRGDPDGRGFVTATKACLPVRGPRNASIAIFDLQTGKPEEPLVFETRRLGNLLSLEGRLLVANEQEVSLFASLDAELGRLKDASGPRFLEERALTALLEDRAAEARSDFRAAIEAEERAGRPAEATRRRAVENLFAIARATKDLSALEEARRLAPNDLYRAQSLLVEAEVLSQTERPEEAFAALDRLVREHPKAEVVLGNDVLTATRAATEQRKLILRVREDYLPVFERNVRAWIEAAAAKEDLEELVRIPALFGLPPADEAWLRLASIHAAKGRAAEAELALRCLVRDYPESPLRPVAHLRIALSLLARGAFDAARSERGQAAARMEGAAPEAKDLLREFDEALPPATGGGAPPKIPGPLGAEPFPRPDACPVPIPGSPLLVVADASGFSGLRPDGSVLWRYLRPSPCGSPERAETLPLAAAVAEARFGAMAGNEILLADLFGIARLDAATGSPRWERRQPAEPGAFASLEEDALALRKGGDLLRRGRLPLHALLGRYLWRVSPRSGVEVIDAETGETVARDPAAGESLAGPPHAQGSLVVVGWASPGRVRIYQMDGRLLRERTVPVLLAPPILDPEGRLFLVSGDDEEAGDGRLLVVDAAGEGEHPGTGLPVHFRYAALLHADGELAVFHDGSARPPNAPQGNLHFIDFRKRTTEAVHAPEMLREFSTCRLGDSLFVFSRKRGFPDEGARLFRVDIQARRCLAYAVPIQAGEYAPPLLTREAIFVAGGSGPTAFVQAFDTEATPDRRGPAQIFLAGGDLRSFLSASASGSPRFDSPPSLGILGPALLFGSPAGALRLAAASHR